jgi:putative ABC transport system permease protein
MSALLITCRSLIRRPSFTAGAVMTLALGVGATTAMFSVVDTVLIQPLPFPGADRLVRVMEANPGNREKTSLVAPGRLEDWNHANRTFDALSASYSESVTDTSGIEPERLAGLRVAPRYFIVFGMKPLAGRAFSAAEERFGGPHAVVIGEALWTRRFARDPSAVARRLVIGGIGYTIVGVMPSALAWRSAATSAGTDVWIPAQTPPGLLRVREARFMSGVGRIRSGISLEQGRADLERVQRALGEQFPSTDKDWSVSVTDLKEWRVGQYRRALWLVFGAVALLFAIAVANIAGLMLVQLRRRARELSIRQAIGGSRTQIVGAVMREVIVIAVAGSLAGAVLARALVLLFARTFADVPRAGELALDGRALAFTIGATAAAVLTFGLWPALHATRTDLSPLLAQGDRRSSGVRHRLQELLVVLQIALSIVLAASAGLLVRSYYNLTRVDAGFHADHVMTFHVGAAWDEDRNRVGELQERLLAEVQQLPGVSAVGITNFLPATGATLRYQIALEGITTTEDNGKISVGSRTVSAGYLRALGVPSVAGDWCPPLRPGDLNGQGKAMVNRAFADRYGPDLVGRHFTFDQFGNSNEIIGVIGNIIEDGPSAAPMPYVYMCATAGAWPDPEYVVRAWTDPRILLPAIREVVRRLDPTRAVFGARPVAEVVAGALDQPRLNAQMLTVFAAAAITLASVGLYSLLTLLISERFRELGVRIALGARPVRVVGLVVGGAGRLLVVGTGMGLLLTFAAGRVLQAALFGLGAMDAPTLAGSIAVLGAVTIVAAAVPAARAASIDPIAAIRSE